MLVATNNIHTSIRGSLLKAGSLKLNSSILKCLTTSQTLKEKEVTIESC